MTEGLFAAPVYKNYGKQILNEAYEPAGFYLQLGLKDANLVTDASENLNVPMPLLDLVRGHYDQAMQKGWSDKDWASIATLIGGESGRLTDDAFDLGALYRAAGAIWPRVRAEIGGWPQAKPLDLVRLSADRGPGTKSAFGAFRHSLAREARAYLAHPLLGAAPASKLPNWC